MNLTQIVKLYDGEWSFNNSISLTILRQIDACLCSYKLFTSIGMGQLIIVIIFLIPLHTETLTIFLQEARKYIISAMDDITLKKYGEMIFYLVVYILDIGKYLLFKHLMLHNPHSFFFFFLFNKPVISIRKGILCKL